jgi:hypothetical protein
MPEPDYISRDPSEDNLGLGSGKTRLGSGKNHSQGLENFNDQGIRIAGNQTAIDRMTVETRELIFQLAGRFYNPRQISKIMAEQIGLKVSAHSVRRVIRDPEYQSVIAEHAQKFLRGLADIPIAHSAYRLQAYQDVHERVCAIMDGIINSMRPPVLQEDLRDQPSGSGQIAPDPTRAAQDGEPLDFSGMDPKEMVQKTFALSNYETQLRSNINSARSEIRFIASKATKLLAGLNKNTQDETEKPAQNVDNGALRSSREALEQMSDAEIATLLGQLRPRKANEGLTVSRIRHIQSAAKKRAAGNSAAHTNEEDSEGPF